MPPRCLLPPRLAAPRYLTGLEGPFWRQIRGQGLSYGYGLAAQPEKGSIVFSLSRSSKPVEAWKEAQRVIREFVEDEDSLDETDLEGTKSSVVYEIVAREGSLSSAASQRMMSALRRAPSVETFNKDLLAATQKVTLADLRRVLNQYLHPLTLTPAQAAVAGPGSKPLCLSISTSKGSFDAVQAAFKADGWDIDANNNAESFCMQ
jgi:Zn-dependent M16 (insulinase) family peptidase